MKASPVVHSLNGGEFAPLASGRSDLGKYANGASLMQNFVGLIQGPAQRRGGTAYISAKKADDKDAWLVRFEFSQTQAWVLEFGDHYLRFYTNHGQAVVSGVSAWSAVPVYAPGDLVSRLGVNYYAVLANNNEQPPNATYWYPLEGAIYEIPSPYALADLTNPDGTFALKIAQSGDVLYIANQYRTYVPRKLTRHGNTKWVFTTYNPSTGPFLEMNLGATTIYASANSGSVTLTASASLFTASDVGRLLRLEVQDLDVEPWETDKSYSTNDLVRFGGKTYKCLGNDTSGTSPPIHEHGIAFDGKGGVEWEYQDPAYAIFRITVFTDATHVTANVIQDEANGLKVVPAALVGSPASKPSKRWSLGAWSNATEWPSTVAICRDRLWWGGLLRYWASVPQDFENMMGDFFGEVRADNAIWRHLLADDVNEIVWLADIGDLAIGTSGGEFIVSEITNSQPLGPGNIKHKRHSKYRCRAVQPLIIGSKLIYVQRAGRKLLSMGYDLNTDRFLSKDLAVLSDRMTRTGIVEMAFQAEPTPIIWCRLSNGMLRGFTYHEEHDVAGWHRHPIGGTNVEVKGLVVIPAPDGTRDEPWLLVKRMINGATARYIEYVRKPWEGRDNDGSAGDDPHDAFYVDSGLTYTAPPATVNIDDVDVLALGLQIATFVDTDIDHNLLVGQTITISGVIATGAYAINGARTVLAVISARRIRVSNAKGVTSVFGSYIGGGSFPSLAALATTITGLEHLEGERVQICTDGAAHPDRTVSSGSVVLTAPCQVAHIGLACPARLITNDLEAGGPAGTSMGKTSRINRAAVRLIDSLGGKIGVPADDPADDSALDPIDYRVPADPMDSGPPFRTTIIDVEIPGEWGRQKRIEILADQPLPMTVGAIMPRVNVNDG